MITAPEILERAESVSRTKNLALPKKARDALRKNRDNNTLPSLPTLSSISATLDCSISYLIAETDDPASAAPLQKSGAPLTLIALEATATPTFPDQGHPTVLMSIQTTTHGEAGVLLPPREAAWLADRLKDAAGRIADHETARSSKPSATTS